MHDRAAILGEGRRARPHPAAQPSLSIQLSLPRQASPPATAASRLGITPRPRMHPVRNTLALALMLAIPTVAIANDAAPDGSDPSIAAAATGVIAANEFDRIVVTATLTERALDDVPNVVTAIDRDEMDRNLVRDLKDLFRYEPGIAVSGGSGRFGGLGDI